MLEASQSMTCCNVVPWLFRQPCPLLAAARGWVYTRSHVLHLCYESKAALMAPEGVGAAKNSYVLVQIKAGKILLMSLLGSWPHCSKSRWTACPGVRRVDFLSLQQ